MLILLIVVLILFYFLTKDDKSKPNNFVKREEKHKSRDKRKINDANFTQADKKYIFEKFDYRCFNCGSKRNLTIDHHYPLEKGYGLKKMDGTYNAVILCEKCNRKKSNKMPENFYNGKQLQILAEKYGLTKDMLEKNEDILKFIDEKTFVEFLYLGKEYKGKMINILNEDIKKWGTKRKTYLEIEINGENSIFPLEGVKNITKIK